MSCGITHSRSQELIDAAYGFAAEAHNKRPREEKNRWRKYTGEPYIVHPVAVARIVASVTDDCNAICAALLHDVIEDTFTTYEDLISVDNGFGSSIADLVVETSRVSKPEDGNRAIRKAIDREHYAKASPLGQTIKIADFIDNQSSIVEYDPGFAITYMAEQRELVTRLVKGDEILYHKAIEILEEYYK